MPGMTASSRMISGVIRSTTLSAASPDVAISTESRIASSASVRKPSVSGRSSTSSTMSRGWALHSWPVSSRSCSAGDPQIAVEIESLDMGARRLRRNAGCPPMPCKIGELGLDAADIADLAEPDQFLRHGRRPGFLNARLCAVARPLGRCGRIAPDPFEVQMGGELVVQLADIERAWRACRCGRARGSRPAAPSPILADSMMIGRRLSRARAAWRPVPSRSCRASEISTRKRSGCDRLDQRQAFRAARRPSARRNRAAPAPRASARDDPRCHRRP